MTLREQVFDGLRPAKAIALPNGNFLVADAEHHVLFEALPDRETVVRRFGTGDPGYADGPVDHARFHAPSGLCPTPPRLEGLGDVLIADSGNHLIRGLRLADGVVTTVAGAGGEFRVGGPENVVGPDGGPAQAFDPTRTYGPTDVRLATPSDIIWSPKRDAFVIAMAGSDSLWAFDGIQIALLAGSMERGHQDGPADTARLDRPTALALGVDGRIWIADDGPAPRWLAGGAPGVTPARDGVIHSAAPDRAGPADDITGLRGIAPLPDGSVIITDPVAGTVRRCEEAADGSSSVLASGLTGAGRVFVLIGGYPWRPDLDLAETSGNLPVVDADVWDEAGVARSRIDLMVARAGMDKVAFVGLDTELVNEIIDRGVHRLARHPVQVAPGVVTLEIPFSVGAGNPLDGSATAPTELEISAVPPRLLLGGADRGTDLVRELTINPDVPGGILRVRAIAHVADAVETGVAPDPAPADDLLAALSLALELEEESHQDADQRWEIAVQVSASGADTLLLPMWG